MQESFPGVWLNIGVDTFGRVVPPRYWPGIGLRPGGRKPELEAILPALNAGLYETVAAHARQGLSVVVDIGHHEAYPEPLGLLADGMRRLAGLPVLLVGVRCPIEEIMRRRDAGPGTYAQSGPGGEVPGPALRWQEEVHRGISYDLEVDTSSLSAEECAGRILARLSRPARPQDGVVT